MVQVCPKCGTQDPADNAVFCSRCGGRLPPAAPETAEVRCKACGGTITDTRSLFCDRCGARLPPPPPAEEQCPHCGATVKTQSLFCDRCGARLHPAPQAAPAPEPGQCPSCGAPLVDGASDFCNRCGARVRGTVPAGAAPYAPQPVVETAEVPAAAIAAPAVETPSVAPAVTGVPPSVGEVPAPERPRKPRLKWVLVAGAGLILLIVVAAFFTGMLPGTGTAPEPTPAPAPGTQGTTAVPTTVVPVKTATPAPTHSPAVTKTATPLPTTAVPATTPAPVATTKTAATPNASVQVTAALTIRSASQRFSLGQAAYDGKGTLTVNGFSFRDKMSDPTPSYAVGRRYLIINITYANLDRNATVNIDASTMKVTDGGGYPADPATDALLETPWNGNAIRPQEKRTGNLLFLVLPSATYLKLEYTSLSGARALFQLT